MLFSSYPIWLLVSVLSVITRASPVSRKSSSASILISATNFHHTSSSHHTSSLRHTSSSHHNSKYTLTKPTTTKPTGPIVVTLPLAGVMTITPLPQAPIYNVLKNTTCYDIDHTKSAKDQWIAVGGYFVMDNFTRSFANDNSFCPQCMGWPRDQCPEAQHHNPKASFNNTCAQGIRSFSDNRWDRAAANFAGLTSRSDLSCGLEISDCMTSPECGDTFGPSVYAIVKSLSTLNNLLFNTYQAINDAMIYCNSQMDSFSKDFAPTPPPSNTAWIGMLSMFINTVGGYMSISAPLEGLTLSFASSLANSAMAVAAAAPNHPADTGKPMGNIAQAAIKAIEKLADALFKDGKATHPKAADGTTELKLEDVFSDGQMMRGPDDYNVYKSQLVTAFKKSLFQQTAVFTWENLDQDKAIPYIAFEKGSCQSNAGGGPLDKEIDDLDRSKSAIDFEGDCYYLLAGVIDVNNNGFGGCGISDSKYNCVGNGALPGGTHDVLTGRSNQYAGLKIDDFVVPAVKGWKAAGNTNLYSLADSQGSIVKDIWNPGVVWLPVCDYVGNSDNPGDGCPYLGLEDDGATKCSIYGTVPKAALQRREPASERKQPPGERRVQRPQGTKRGCAK